MKKILALLLALAMVFAFAACGSNDSNSGDDNKGSGSNEGGSAGGDTADYKIGVILLGDENEEMCIRDRTYDEEYAAGQVIAQDPQEGRQLTLVEGGITINLTVSQGPKPEILMPAVVNKDYREVDIELRNLGLNLDIKYESEYDDSITESYVISQIPEAGTPLTEGSTVYITYSLGPETKYTTCLLYTSCARFWLVAEIMRISTGTG